MGGRLDIIKAIVVIFAVGLVITGFTSIHTAGDRPRYLEPVAAGVPVVTVGASPADERPNR